MWVLFTFFAFWKTLLCMGARFTVHFVFHFHLMLLSAFKTLNQVTETLIYPVMLYIVCAHAIESGKILSSLCDIVYMNIQHFL